MSVLFHASDDRSAEVFQRRIDTATQMKSVLGTNQRPNCLIIDEIDGAPTVRHESLLRLSYGPTVKQREGVYRPLNRKGLTCAPRHF